MKVPTLVYAICNLGYESLPWPKRNKLYDKLKSHGYMNAMRKTKCN